MKKILIFLLIISLILLEGCATIVGHKVGSGINKEDLHSIKELESTDINEPANQPAEMSVLQNISFQAKENPFIVVSFQDQQIEGLLMGVETDSVLLKTEQSLLLSQRSFLFSTIHRISINEIHHIRVIKKSKSVEYLGYGLLMGVGTGIIIGLASGDDSSGYIQVTAAEKALIFGGVLGLPGGFIGAIVGEGAGRDSIYDLSEQDHFQKIQIIRKLSGYTH